MKELRHLFTRAWLLPTLVFTILLVLGATMHPLWGDEAETALFGRNILKYGVPQGWDGTNIMGINNAVVLDKQLVNHTSPWAQYYMVAGAFALFGQNSFTARVPSILLVILVIPLTYYIARRFFKSHEVGVLAVWLLALSIPFVLFGFQARYYALTSVAALVFFISAFRLVQVFSFRWASLFILSAVAFFYGNYVSFVAWYAAVLIVFSVMALRAHGGKGVWVIVHRFLPVSLLVLCFTAPWYILLKPFESRGSISIPPFVAFFQYLSILIGEAYAPYNESNAFPIVLALGFVVLIFYRFLQKKTVSVPLAVFAVPAMYLTIMSLFTLVAMVDTAFVHVRYTMIVYPFFILCLAYLFYEMKSVLKKGIWIVLAVYIGTNLFTLTPFRSFIWDFAMERRHPYKTPDIEVANYLKAHAKKGDTAFVNLDRDHEPLIFHLGDYIRFVNRVSLVNTRIFPENRAIIPRYIYDFRDEPDWIILYSKRTNDDSFFMFDYRAMAPEINLSNYDEVALPVFFSDMSRPEIDLRSFYEMKPKGGDSVYIYKRRAL
jgi:hypothetical protein